MNLVILGVGKVGGTLVENLVKENHNIVVIDNNPKTLENIVSKYDVKGIIGSGISRSVLSDAGVSKADFFIASTSRDEVNIVCSVLAKKMGARYTVARVRDPEYFKEISDMKAELSLDMAFNPEYKTALEIANVLKFPSAVNVENFTDSSVSVVDFLVAENNPVIGKRIMDIVKEYSSNLIFAMVSRNGKEHIPLGSFEIEEGDKISVIGKDKEIAAFCKKLHIYKMPAKSAFIIGGGKIGFYLARELCKNGIDVKVVEKDEKRCETLSSALPNANVILGDGSSQELLEEEGLKDYDACVTLTGMDEENAMLSLFAKQLKVNKVVTKIDRPSLLKMVKSMGLDSACSPREIIANSILRFVRSRQGDFDGRVMRLYRLGETVEALEFIVGESFPCGVPIKEIKFQKDILICGIVRNGEYVLPVGDSTFTAGDKIIVAAPARKISEISEILR